LNELEKLEQRADVLLRHVEVNCKKVRQHNLKSQIWDTRRLEATLRTLHELVDLTTMINELVMHPDREVLLGSS
jgi:hypothetical protein